VETISALWRRQVARGGESEALIFVAADGRESRFSWHELDARVAAIGRGLAARGIGPGDRVGVHLPNGVDFFCLYFALAHLGATIVATNLRSASDELRYALDHASTIAIFAGSDDLARHAAALDQVPSLRIRIAAPLDDLAKEAPGGTLDDRARPDDDAVILYTSGTTKRPKAVRLPHAAMALAAARMVENTSLTDGDRHAVCAPMFHINAQTYSILPAITAGASILLMERFSRSRWLPLCTAHAATVASLVSSMIRLLLDSSPSEAERTHKLRLIGCAARHRELEARFGVATLGWYGMTETVGVPIVGRPSEGPFGAIGKVRDGYGLRVRVGERDATDGEPGELQIRGAPGRDLMRGYLGDDEATSAAFSVEGGATWLRTGDLVKRDADGFVYYLERGGDVIRRGGENVSAAEVERVLCAHPSVREAAAVGLEDRLLGQRVAAAVILRDGASATADELLAHARAMLADFKVPSELAIVTDLPRSTLDKVNRAELKKRWPGS
jgi:crotonobetaine/carnitine-CoA ligase